jgi:aspartate/methionine/tyrosine aminotransferase
MWFERMTLEIWFDKYQYQVDYDIGESAIKFRTVDDLDIDLGGTQLRYGHHTGRPDLRDCIADQYSGMGENNVVVTTGASEAIFTVTAALVEPGDHVIVEHPNYPSLYSIPRGLGCEVTLLTLDYQNDFIPDLELLRSKIKPNTKLISFTHPNNPTGSMITRDELSELIKIVDEHDLILLFDETYREMDFNYTLPHAATLSDRAVSISTMSKSFGLPGIRIGWVVTGNSELLSSILTIREQTSITNNALGEVIALNTLNRKDEFMRQVKEHINNNLSIVADWMTHQELFEWVHPEAGVVSFPHIKSHIKIDPEEFYRHLVEDYRTFVVPGRCFEMDNRYFRLGFGGFPDEIEIGLNNLDQAINDLV